MRLDLMLLDNETHFFTNFSTILNNNVLFHRRPPRPETLPVTIQNVKNSQRRAPPT